MHKKGIAFAQEVGKLRQENAKKEKDIEWVIT